VAFDLVILNEQPTSYIKTLHDEIDFLMRSLESPNGKGELGRVFHIKSDLIPAEDNQALIYAASVQLDSKQGTFESQLATKSSSQSLPVQLKPTAKLLSAKETPILKLPKDLKFFNGFGGFDQERNEYVITINEHLKTPAPWTNIIANDELGFVVSESGSGFTWAGDSYDNRLTRWSNDPLLDHGGEAVYLRDEETGEFWSATPLPVQTKGNYIVRHGLGYSSFEHAYQGIHHTTTLIAPLKDSIKIYDLHLKNTSSKPRSISITGYFEPSLGVHRQHTKNLLTTERDGETKALTIKNIYRSNAFQSTLMFVDMNRGEFKATNNREEFIGRGQSMKNPAALYRTDLSDTLATGVDTCAVTQSKITLLPGETKTIQIFIGQAVDKGQSKKLIEHYRKTYALDVIKNELVKHWQKSAQNIQIKTPDEQLDMLINYRLNYQAITARLVAKTGYYQPSGAFGFRDQLQDSLALIHTQPEKTKEMILKAAAHQFKEGDAQNWWHEHNNFGVRTISTDHQVWLPYVVEHYLDATNETQLLDNKLPFVESPVPHFEDYPEWAGIPQKTEETYTIYEHCLRAIKKTAQLGTHNLPLIGKSDWNDGLSNVGIKGRGESVWLGWLLRTVAERFITIAQERNDEATVIWLTELIEKLESGLERHAWDGNWYKRAYFDSGAPLGSHRNKEYRIDSIVQSWAVLGGGKREERIKKALSSAVKQLVDPVDQIVRLINPPVVEGSIDPGYLKDYPAGVRENGAQYNHAALWLSQALFATGNADQAKMILDFANPLKRTETSEDTKRYRVEPYVLASDIYADPSYPGRGGWTWYTGSAGVFYRTITDYLFGISIKKEILTINPSIPRDWKEAQLTLIHKNITYQINIQNPYQATQGVAQTKLNGKILTENKIHLTNNQKTNTIEILLAPSELQ
jgi:cellobiose phosphorylase